MTLKYVQEDEDGIPVMFGEVPEAGGDSAGELLASNKTEQEASVEESPAPSNPEPVPENLTEICKVVKESGADLGVIVDPDVDRLALVCETGELFGEEYTLVSVADYVLSNTPGNTVSNLSSSRALRDVTEKHGMQYNASAVGEVNVTTMMKDCGAIIGGEGNGGVIYPALHYGRDAMVGVALFLTNLAYKKMSVSELLKTYPQYVIAKNKIELSDSALIDKILNKVKEIYAAEDIEGAIVARSAPAYG